MWRNNWTSETFTNFQPTNIQWAICNVCSVIYEASQKVKKCFSLKMTIQLDLSFLLSPSPKKAQLFAHTRLFTLHNASTSRTLCVKHMDANSWSFAHPSFIFFPILSLQILWKREILQPCFQNPWGKAAKSRTHETQIVSMPTAAQALPTHHSLLWTQVICARCVNGG